MSVSKATEMEKFSRVGFKTRECEVLVIGGGGAGVFACIEASQRQGLKTILVSKGPISQSGLTPTANGGTHVPPSPDRDGINKMFEEIINAGQSLNDHNIVWHLAKNIQDCLEELQRLGVPVTRLAPMSVCVPCTATLRKFRQILLSRPNVELMEDVLVTGLLTSNGRVTGVTALDLVTGEFIVISATAVVVATGGLTGELYPHSSNNPFGITTDASGTGHIMAYLAGAELIDMEMVQFVPLPSNPQCLYLRYFPEFWAGPYFNRHGEVVIQDAGVYVGASYSHQCVQKLFREKEKGNWPIYIDHRGFETPHSKIKSWEDRRKLIKMLGIDPVDRVIEITIGSHYCMGGIRVNEKTESSIPGLFASGEVMGGVHGGLRLAGVSLSHMIVFGFEAGKQAADYAEKTRGAFGAPFDLMNTEREKALAFLEPKANPLTVPRLKYRLQQIMEEHVFVLREEAGLKQAIESIRGLKKDVARISVPGSRHYNMQWAQAIELPLMIQAAEIIAESALARQESRGAHFRRDFPQADDIKWREHTRAKLVEGSLKIDTTPVTRRGNS